MSKDDVSGPSNVVQISAVTALIVAIGGLFAGYNQFTGGGSIIASQASANNTQHEHSTQQMNRDRIETLEGHDRQELQRITVLETQLKAIDDRTKETAKGMRELLKRVPE